MRVQVVSLQWKAQGSNVHLVTPFQYRNSETYRFLVRQLNYGAARDRIHILFCFELRACNDGEQHSQERRIAVHLR